MVTIQQSSSRGMEARRLGIDEAFKSRTPKSRAMFEAATKIMPGGQSHNARNFEPYPFFATKARGRYVWDIDGNRYTDYWMGHTALVLGHSPPLVVNELRKQIENGLLIGTANRYAFNLAQLVTEIVPCAESVRFCTTGAEATMYAVRLARAYTKRNHIVKMAGGWHGYNSSLTYGVSEPYGAPESGGLIPEEQEKVKLAPLNRVEETAQILTQTPDIAAVIMEPVMGGGVLPAEKTYLQAVRRMCTETGAVLIFDEIITGFRLALGGGQEFYGITPDLCTLGKILGGGLPASAVAGKKEIMELANASSSRGKTERAWIGGGTFSEHALSMRAGIATLTYLEKNKKKIYSQLNANGERLRKSVDAEFQKCNIRTITTGAGSLFATHFLQDDQAEPTTPRDLSKSKKELELLYGTSLISEHHILVLPGHISAISTAHTASDLRAMQRASRAFAESIQKYQQS